MSDCAGLTEDCHDQPCDGHNEVSALIRGLGPIFEGRRGVIGQILAAMGAWKTCLNIALCREFCEDDPCKTVRHFARHARLWRFPSCVPQDNGTLCAWIALQTDPSCPPGTVGWLRKVIDFVMPDKSVSVEITPPKEISNCAADSAVAAENAIIITAPPECFKSALEAAGDRCRLRYFIPEIDCIRSSVLPFGVGIGLRTDPPGPNGEDIWGVTADPICPAPPRPFLLKEKL